MTVQEITAQELKALKEKDLVKLIDVREAIENAEEKIPDSVLLPLSSFDVSKASADKKPNQKLVLHCRSGKRSMKAADKLIESGYQEEIYSLQGGIEAWKNNGFETIKSQNMPISLPRQIQIAAGSLVLLGVILAYLFDKKFVLLSGFVGAGLIFAGITNTCGLGLLLAQMPWNQNKNK